MKRVLVVRQDNNGDVLLAGPAIRSIAAAAHVTLLCGPRGASAARMLPGVEEVLVHEAAWIDAEPQPLTRAATATMLGDVMRCNADEAIILTSFHQSPLPMALLLRLAGVARIGAISVDYAGTLLDVRHKVSDDVHEVQRALSLTRAMGYELPAGDAGSLRLKGVAERTDVPFAEYVVVHPGATVPARAWFPERNRLLVERLTQQGTNVVVTGTKGERGLAEYVCGQTAGAVNAAGTTSFAQFAAIVRNAHVVICGNTAAAHVAAAVGTPVVSIFAPTIPAVRFRPWMVDHVLLGDQEIACKGCRARACPYEAQPCLDTVSVDDVLRSAATLSRPRMVLV